jgi:type II secretory pathway component GspD/PulD (secretin)
MNGSNTSSRVGLAVVMGLLLTCSLFGSVRSAAQPTEYTLHIDSQALDGALQEFARQTGMQILFFSRLTDGQRSVALHGAYTLDEAMKALLSESKLTYRVINTKTIQIVPLRTARASRKADQCVWRGESKCPATNRFTCSYPTQTRWCRQG